MGMATAMTMAWAAWAEWICKPKGVDRTPFIEVIKT